MKIIKKINNIFTSQVKEKWRVVLNKDGSTRAIVEPSENSITYSEYEIVELEKDKVTKVKDKYIIEKKTLSNIKAIKLDKI